MTVYHGIVENEEENTHLREENADATGRATRD